VRKLDSNFERGVEIMRIEGAHLLFPFIFLRHIYSAHSANVSRCSFLWKAVEAVLVWIPFHI
jgi:hypothetical protein